MKIRWVSETGIVENVAAVVKDFKETRGLLVCLYQFIYLSEVFYFAFFVVVTLSAVAEFQY